MVNTLRAASKDTRIAARYIPKGARRVALKSGDAVAYLYESAGRYLAIGYRGTAGRSAFHESYRTAERREKAVREFFAGVQASAKYRAERRAAKAAWSNPLTVGAVLYTSWGYDQTNVEFFAVTRVSGRRVWIREIASDSEATGSMQGICWPAMPIRFVGEETMHTAQPAGERGVYVRISASRSAWLEDGRTHHYSSYA